MAHAQEGEYTAAEAAYRSAIALAENDDELHLGLAQLYLGWGRPDEGLTALAAASAPYRVSSPDARLLYAQLLGADEQWGAAIAAASAALAEEPDAAAAWQTLIAAYLALNQCDRAQAAADRAIATTSDPPSEIRETAYLLSGNYTALAEVSPGLAAPLATCERHCDIALGRQLIGRQSWPLAACLLGRGLADRDADAETQAETHAWLGEALVHIGRNGEAGAHLRQAVELAPQSPLAWLLLGKYALITGDFETGQTALFNAHQFDPESPAPCLAMAELYAAQGYYADAAAWMDAALARAPVDADIWVSAARFYLKRDLAAEGALDAITQQALALAPDDPDALVVAAWHLLNGDEPDAALDLLDRAVEAAPRNAEAHYLRGVALQRTGAAEEAGAAFVLAGDLGEPRAWR